MGAPTALQAAEEAVRLADVEPARAVAAAEDAVLAARRERDGAAAATAERAWGHALLASGDMPAAVLHLRRAIGHGLRAGSPPLVGEARMKLAYAMTQLGRPRRALTEIDAALLDLDGPSGARALAQRAAVLHELGRLDQALGEYDAAIRSMRAAGDLLGLQRALLNRALVHIELHLLTDAEAGLLEARSLARRSGRKLALGLNAENLGVVARLRGDVPAAMAYFDEAERIVVDQGGTPSSTFRDRAELLLSVGLASEARASAERALGGYQREQRLLKVPEVRLLLAEAAGLDRDWPTALTHARTAVREFTAQQRPEWAEAARLHALNARLATGGDARVSADAVESMVTSLTAAGWPAQATEARLVAARLALRRGRVDAGARHLDVARRARRSGPVTLRARGWYADALRRLTRGDRPGALGAARRGLRMLDEHSAAMGATDLRAHAAIHRTDLTELGLRIALDGGRAAQVLEWAERGRASQLLHRPARPPDDPLLAVMLTELRAVAVEISRSDSAAPARLVRRQVELERRIRDHSRLRRGSSADRLPGPVPVSKLAAVLGDRALVEFVQLDGALHGLSLIGGRLRLRPLGPATAVAELVDRLPFALHRLARRNQRPSTVDAALALLRSAAGRLDDALLRPFTRELGDRPLVVVPTGVLHSVPWSVLPSCAGRPVAVSPSATLWHSASQVRAGGGSVGVAAGPRLHGALAEAGAVAAIHRTTALTGDAATVDAVLGSLASADLVHLAAHGRLSADNPLFSDLQLADGPLVVYDLERLARVPQTVVLAACDSGRSVVRTGDELLGLSATFIASGSAQLVASVLPIPDAETAPLMVAFHERLAGGVPPAVALAAAQGLLGADDPAALAAAAGFVCLGAG